jgi:hypothetical protein
VSGNSGSNSSSGSGGSTSGNCPNIFGAPLTDCPGDLVEVAGALIDFCTPDLDPLTLTPTDQIVDFYNQSIVASHDGCGIFYFCLAPGTTVTPVINVPSYLTTVLPAITANANTIYDYQPGVYMICSSFADADFPAQLNYDVTEASVLVQLTYDGIAVDGGAVCTNLSGWTFELLDDDGGVIPTTKAYVVGSSGFDPNATATDTPGVALLYNISGTVQHGRVVGDNPANDDAGIQCPYNGNVVYGQSSSVLTPAGDLTFMPFIIP